jgi:hypothetical protein
MDKILSDKMGHDMEALVWETAEELDKKLAERMRRIRRRRKVSQQKLSDMSGVSYGSIKRFETTGQISLVIFCPPYILSIKSPLILSFAFMALLVIITVNYL